RPPVIQADPHLVFDDCAARRHLPFLRLPAQTPLQHHDIHLALLALELCWGKCHSPYAGAVTGFGRPPCPRPRRPEPRVQAVPFWTVCAAHSIAAAPDRSLTSGR